MYESLSELSLFTFFVLRMRQSLVAFCKFLSASRQTRFRQKSWQLAGKIIFFVASLSCCPLHVVAPNFSVSSDATPPSAALFQIGRSHVPMLYMTEGPCSWVAAKDTKFYTTDVCRVAVENNAPSGNCDVSESTLRSSTAGATDVLTVERASLVSANRSDTVAFSKLQESVLKACSWSQISRGFGWSSLSLDAATAVSTSPTIACPAVKCTNAATPGTASSSLFVSTILKFFDVHESSIITTSTIAVAAHAVVAARHGLFRRNCGLHPLWLLL